MHMNEKASQPQQYFQMQFEAAWEVKTRQPVPRKLQNRLHFPIEKIVKAIS